MENTNNASETEGPIGERNAGAPKAKLNALAAEPSDAPTGQDGETRFRATFEQAAVGMAHLGLGGRWLGANRRLCAIVGYTPDELLALSFQEITHPDDLDSDLANVRALLAGEIETYATEKRFFRKDRSVVWISSAVSLVRDDAGAPQYFIAVIEDIEKRKQAETTQAQLAAIVASSDDAIIGQSLDGVVSSWNRAAEALFGYREDEIIGRSIVAIIPRERLHEETYIIEQVQAGRTVAHLETVWRHRDGRLLDVSLTVSPIRDSSGVLVGASNIVRDITEGKRTESALRESEARYRLLFDNMTEEVRLWKVHRDEQGLIDVWTLVDANPPVLKSWGKKIDEVVGKTPAEIFGPESLDLYRPVVEKILDKGVPHSFEAHLPVVKKHFKFTAVPLGEYFITTGVDITFQKHAEEELRHLNELLEQRVAERTAELEALWAERSRLASIVENAPDLIGIRNANFDGVYLNPAGRRLVGVESDDEVRRRPPDAYFVPEERPRFKREILPALVERGSWAGELTIQNLRTGERIPALYNVFRIDDAVTGTPAYSAAIVRDLRQRKKLEAQLIHAQKMEAVGQLTGGVAHDFNNLLTTIAGSFELIERAAEGDPTRVRQLVANGLHAADRGARLTSSLLAFSRKQHLKREVVDVNAHIRLIEPLLRQAVGETVDLDILLNSGLGRCEADVAQLETAILNLAINARDAMSDGGELVISTRNAALSAADLAENKDAAAGAFVAIAVEDSGHGIDAEILAKVFEPFFTTKEVGKGSGLGLSQVYGFAHQLGGHVAIDSEPGIGTRVIIYLPAVASEVKQQHAPGDHPMPFAPLIVLLVEDDDLVREMTRQLLEESGCRVLEARHAKEAMGILQANPDIELLFSDVVMPEGVSGIELAQTARKLRPDLKVLLTSGYAEAIANVDAADEQLSVLLKPYRRSDLESRVGVLFSDRTE
jgi:PAS domain S-box-containing protein